ncbi:MAG: putative membrane protein YdjX (TVP38/TMEM64 family), partial [Thalassolituus oleivorans]
YIGATLTMMPGSIFGMLAGFAYGPVVGVLIVSPVSVLASLLAFLLGRTLARVWVAKKVASSPRWTAIDAAIAEDGLKVVLLLRLSPLFPYNLLNYALGLTGVRFRDYLLGSFVGMLPGTILYVYLGSLVTTTTQFLSGELPDVGVWGQTFYVVGLLSTIAVTIIVARKAQGALSRIIVQAPSGQAKAGAEVSERDIE